MWFLVIAAIFCLYVYLWLRMYPGNLPVYPGRLPLLGNISLFWGSTIEIWEKIKKVSIFSNENGDVVIFYLGIIPIYVVSDPDDCSKVMSSSLHRPGFMKKFTRRLLGNGLLVGPVSVWKEHRKLINPTFNQQVLDSFIVIFNSQSRRLVERWKSYAGMGPFDHQLCLEKNTLETVCLTTAGIDITDQNEFNEECLMAYRTVLSSLMDRGKNPLLYINCIYNMSNLKKDEDRNIKITHDLTNLVLKRKREGYKEINNNNSDSMFKPFLHRLLELTSRLSEQDIREEMNNIILTGFETSSGVLLFCLLLIGTYPDVQEKCLQEINEVLGELDRDVTKEDLSQLKYLEAVLKETMRLCPVVPMTGRIITEDMQLKNAVLRKGHLCVVSLYGVLNHPMWGKDVNEFSPERWLDPTRLPQNPNTYGVFGYGRRNCIGKVYAMMTMKVTLVHILRAYRVNGQYHQMRIKNQGINKPADGHHISINHR
uniref:Cytochrome P450 monooxygenase n=1 Tax=Pieris rapae TaxID=64459 RepID=A0A1V0D9H3_PIERA|nr:cytochrome P450 monooxygenase [Pieris rapae]